MTVHKPGASPGIQPLIVVLPAEIHLANAGILGRELAAVFVSGIRTIVADLTGTTFCDSAGTRMLARAYVQAIDSQAELRLAIPGSAVRRALELSGLDRVLPIYPSLDDALAADTAASA